MYMPLCKSCNRPYKVEPRLLECGHMLCVTCLASVTSLEIPKCQTPATSLKISKFLIPVTSLEIPKCPICQAIVKSENRNGLPVTAEVLRILSSKESLPAAVFPRYVKLEETLRKMREKLKLYSAQYTNVVNMESMLDETMKSTHESNIPTLLDVINRLKTELKSVEDLLDKGAIIQVQNELKNFGRPEEFIQSLISRLERREELYAACRIGYEIKYGKLSVNSRWNYRLFIHSLTETKVGIGATVVYFQDIKDCIRSSNILTFIDTPCEDPTKYEPIVFSMEVSALATQFIKICSGECGKTYKGVPFSTVDPFAVENSIHMSVNGYICNGSLWSKPIDYSFNLSVEPTFIKYLRIPDATSNSKMYYGPSNKKCLLLQAFKNGIFRIFNNTATQRIENIIGIVSSGYLKPNTESTILDCGIIVAIQQYDMYKIVRSDILHDIPYAHLNMGFD